MFDLKVSKPQSIANKYVDLEGNLYENGLVIGKTIAPFDYDTQTSMIPFEYSIEFDKNILKFKTNSGEWNAELSPDYYWRNDKITEKDDCFGKGNSKVLAKGKNLYKHILLQDLQSTTSNYTLPDIYQHSNIFYYVCKDDKVDSINACPPGSIFDKGDCQSLDTCTDKSDGFKYADPVNFQKYYECQSKQSISKQCNKDEIFDYDQCIKPKDVCFFKPDGFKIKTGHKTYVLCEGGKATDKKCPGNTYFLKTKCESEACFNKKDEFVVGPKTVNWPFSFHQDYIKCKDGKLEHLKSCPTIWDYIETNVDIIHLPQVFDGQKCVPPKLCENVQLEDVNAVVPAYDFSKQITNWQRSKLFDSVTGYKCLPDLQEITIGSGKIINNYKIVDGCDTATSKIATKWWNKYYDCATQSLKHCPTEYFFDGKECKKRVPNAFKFKYLDIFKFNNSHINNWFKPFLEDSNQKQITCERGYEYMPAFNICTHPDCKPFTFIKSLKRSIKLDDEYECIWEEPAIKKRKYNKPTDLTLNFWEQRFVPKDNVFKNPCQEGYKVSTGNFVLDKTLYMTCREPQPFVFCPFDTTREIGAVTRNYFACMPFWGVYKHKLAANIHVHFLTNEILKIEIPANSSYLHDGQIIQTLNPLDYVPDPLVKEFDFQSNNETIVHFKALSNYPPDTYIKNARVYKTITPYHVYNLINDNETIKNLTFPSFDLEYAVDDLNY